MIADEDDREDRSPTTRRNQCLRIASVAECLEISISSVRRLIRGGQLQAVQIGASVRVTEESLEHLLSAGKRRSRRGSKK